MSDLKKSKPSKEEKKAAKEAKKEQERKAKKEKKSSKGSKKQKNEPVEQVDTSEWKLTDFTRHETLGTGTFGRVYLVSNSDSERFYALKVLRKTLVVRLKQVQHVNNEKEILNLVSGCPFTVQM